MFQCVAEIMIFVRDCHAAAEWYAKLFGIEVTYLENPDYFFIKVGSQEVWFHQADSKVPSGAAGQVPYWQVTNFDAALNHATQLGAQLYRGPLDREDGTFMCQVKDLDGNLIGFFGPRNNL
jgi:predicted enzyme related to lactoylglutathione lyase